MASTDHLTDEEFVTILKAETQAHYWRLFNLGVGGRFHAFLEWCGVMGEHLNITSALLKKGLPAFEITRHTGETPPIAGYLLNYIPQHIDCNIPGPVPTTSPSY